MKPADLQGYVEARAKGRRGLLDPSTTRKEIVTLKTAWNWDVRMRLLERECPDAGFRFAKSEEKPPF